MGKTRSAYPPEFRRQIIELVSEARRAAFGFNPRRRHLSIGYLSPIDYERRHHALLSFPTHISLPPCSRPSRTSPSGGRRCGRP